MQDARSFWSQRNDLLLTTLAHIAICDRRFTSIREFMNRATNLRHLADLCGRMAAVRTSGGHQADRQLVTLADKLDHEAARLEGETEPTVAI
jgi:hypothetical protein